MQVDPKNNFAVYLETGKKRTFAAALAWPGWCRSGRDAGSALQALIEYHPRYGSIIQAIGLSFHPPENINDFIVVEHLEGDTTTDFGSPGRIPASDRHPLAGEELARQQDILKACWQAFDRVAAAARGRPLFTGPRGRGRILDKIIIHVLEQRKGIWHSWVANTGRKSLAH